MAKSMKKKEEEMIDIEDGPMLDPSELMELELHDSRCKMNEAVQEKLELQEKLLQIDYVQKRDVLRKKAYEAKLSAEKAHKDYKKVSDNAYKRLGLDPSLDWGVQDNGSVVLLNEGVDDN